MNTDEPSPRGGSGNLSVSTGRTRARASRNLQPIITLGQPITIDPPWTVESPIRAAGMKFTITDIDPMAIMSGGPTQVQVSVTRAAGMKPIITVGDPIKTGPPTCGTGGVAGVAIGQTCMSEMRAAGGMLFSEKCLNQRLILSNRLD